MPNQFTAYLLLLLDTTETPPRVVDASTYSEPMPTTMPGFDYVEVPHARTSASTYDEAQREARRSAERIPWLRRILRPQSPLPGTAVG